MEVRISKVVGDDVLVLQQTAVSAYNDHYKHLWYDGGKWYTDTYFSVEKLTGELLDSNACFYLAYYQNAPVGFIKLNLHAPLKGTGEKDALELERIYLRNEAVGKGIGRKLVQLTLDIASVQHKTLVWLKAMDTSNDAIAFYKKMDFEIAGTHRLKHPLMKEELKGMVIMTRKI